ncbi:REP-associated tyrosine transposase [Marinoscillum sp.]|uniref:REP-associated tyrosine transposase n=1 Tax=Marinoscillum sp. TaxID=2024838 RepID=UPI003BA9336B
MSGDRYLISDQNALYFVTFTVVGWIDVFTRKEYKIEIVNALNYCIKNKGLIVYSWCIMSNHVHLIIRARDEFRISDIIRDFKKFTSKKIVHLIQNSPESRQDWMLNQFKYAGRNLNRITNYKFWKDDNHAIELSGTMIDKRLDYIHNNPVKAMIVEEPEYYLFSSARDYAGIKGLVNIEFV